MRLTEDEMERFRTLTVEMLLHVRAAYLGTGASALKHWDQIQSRMLSAARRASSPDEWSTMLCRSLQLPALSSSASRVLVDLGAAVRERGAAAQWLDMIQAEYGLILAMTRLAADERRAAREAAAETVDPETGEVRDGG